MTLASDPENIFYQCDIDLPLYNTTTKKPGLLGSEKVAKDGRRFRLCSSDSDIAPGRIVQTTNNVQAIAATYFGRSTALAPVAGEGGAVGDTKVSICVTSGITVNEYAGGYLMITTATGIGYCYKVKANEVCASSGGSLIHLYAPGLAAALANDSVGVLVASPYADVAIGAYANFGSDQNQVIVGVCMANVTAGTDVATQYFWVQTAGMGIMISGTGVQKQGGLLSIAEDVNGYVQKADATDANNAYQLVGVALEDTGNAVGVPVFVLPQAGI